MPTSESEKKNYGKEMIKGYVIGGPPGREAIEDQGERTEVGYFKSILKSIMRESGLSLDEVRAAIEESPDTVENRPNMKRNKPQFLKAADRLQRKSSI